MRRIVLLGALALLVAGCDPAHRLDLFGAKPAAEPAEKARPPARHKVHGVRRTHQRAPQSAAPAPQPQVEAPSAPPIVAPVVREPEPPWQPPAPPEPPRAAPPVIAPPAPPPKSGTRKAWDWFVKH